MLHSALKLDIYSEKMRSICVMQIYVQSFDFEMVIFLHGLMENTLSLSSAALDERY